MRNNDNGMIKPSIREKFYGDNFVYEKKYELLEFLSLSANRQSWYISPDP